MYYCKKCYSSFRSKEKLEKIHTPLCIDNENVSKVMPEKGKTDIVKFRDFHMQIMQSFMIIADFQTYTNESNQIKPYSFAMFTHCIFDEDKNELTSFTGENCLDNFFAHFNYHVNRINKMKTRPNPYSNPKAYKNNTSKTICLICNKEVLTDKPHTYRFYCKKTGYFYGFKRGYCKIRNNEIILLFHNRAKFDFSLIITYLAGKCPYSNISCISNSMETFLTFSINNFDNTAISLRFIDSYEHLTYRLDGLIKSLLNKDADANSIKNKFPSLSQYFDDKALKLLRKGVYSFDFVDENWKDYYQILNIFIVV